VNPVNSTPFYFSTIHFNIIPHLSLGLRKGLFPSDPPYRTLHAFLFSPMLAAYPAHLISVVLIIIIISGEDLKLLNSSLWNFLSFLLFHPSCVQIFSWAPASQTSSFNIIPLISQTKFHTHTKLQSKLWFCILHF
jgi:hypothetical protein